MFQMVFLHNLNLNVMHIIDITDKVQFTSKNRELYLFDIVFNFCSK